MGRASHQSFCESVRGCICAWGGGAGDGGGAARGLTSRRARFGPSGPSVAAEGLRNVASRQVSAAPRAGVRCWFMYAGAGRSSRTGPAPPWMCAPLDTGPDHGEDGPATPLNGAKHRAGPAGAAPLTCRAAPGPPPPMPGAPAPRRARARQRGPPTPRKCVLRRVGPRPRESGCWEDRSEGGRVVGPTARDASGRGR